MIVHSDRERLGAPSPVIENAIKSISHKRKTYIIKSNTEFVPHYL